MFEAVISDTKSWRNSIEAIAALIDEGTLHIKEDGLKLKAMDPSQIALVDFELPSGAFEGYKVDKDVDIGIDFSELSRITKRSKAGDKIKISLKERFKMVFEGETTRAFDLAIIGSTSTPPREPSIDFTGEIKLGASILKEALKDAELVSNHVAILADENSLAISAEGDTGSVNIDIPSDNILGIDVSEGSRTVFSLDQLNNLLKASDQGSIVILNLKTDAPLRLEYAIGDGRVIYYLAPRIES